MRIVAEAVMCACLTVACGGTVERIPGGEAGAGGAGIHEEAGTAGALAVDTNGGWVDAGGCARWVAVYGPWPRPVECPRGRIECDGSDSVLCEVEGASDCYSADPACVWGTWAGSTVCLPVCPRS